MPQVKEYLRGIIKVVKETDGERKVAMAEAKDEEIAAFCAMANAPVGSAESMAALERLNSVVHSDRVNTLGRTNRGKRVLIFDHTIFEG
ncbi:hypothetical protein HY439_02605 [Candidatus Microgenomates bacterium]|nr:hypothetical protein [Candidatus Microgenomates bacterium]